MVFLFVCLFYLTHSLHFYIIRHVDICLCGLYFLCFGFIPYPKAINIVSIFFLLVLICCFCIFSSLRHRDIILGYSINILIFLILIVFVHIWQLSGPNDIYWIALLSDLWCTDLWWVLILVLHLFLGTLFSSIDLCVCSCIISNLFKLW